MSDDNLEVLYHKFWSITGELLSNGTDPLEIAGILTAQGLAIYKTVLSEEDFELMVNDISNSRDRVRAINMETLQ